MRKWFLVWSIFIIISHTATAQIEVVQGLGGQVGISFNIGSHFNRLGLMAKLYYHKEYVQANVQVAGYYNFNTFAISKPSWEGQLRLGLVAAFGEKYTTPNPFIHEVGHQTGRAFSVGYSYNFYWDNVQTSQRTATLGLGAYGARMIVENDFMVFKNEDKFRTGVMVLSYRYQNTQFSTIHAAWTGDPYAEGTSRVMDDANFPSKYGYREMANAPYSEFGSGVLAVGVEQYVGYGQYLGASIGVDAAEIRNFMQNKVIHESHILKNPHIPMVDTEGNQYLYKEGQTIREPLFFLQFMANTGNFY